MAAPPVAGRVRLRSGSPGVVGAGCNSSSNGRTDISQTLNATRLNRAIIGAAMNLRTAVLASLALIPLQTPAAPVPLDLSGLRPGPITVVRGEDSVTVTWPDETARIWRATFS